VANQIKNSVVYSIFLAELLYNYVKVEEWTLIRGSIIQ